MSLRLRIGFFIRELFAIKPDGLSIKDLERGIKVLEGKYFYLYETQGGIVDGLDLMKRSPLERHIHTKHNSSGRDKFWNYEKGKYFLNKELRIYEESKEIFNKIKKGEKIEEVDPCLVYILFEDKVKSILEENKQGIKFKDLYNNFKDFYSLFKEYNQEETESSFCSLMSFQDKHPYEKVYFNKKRPENLKYNEFSWAEQPFRDWEYKNGFYYANEKFLKDPEIKFENPEAARKYYMSKIEDLTLLDQINSYCNLRKLTNSNFLKMHAFMQANLDASRRLTDSNI
jgi:hypothetical protein